MYEIFLLTMFVVSIAYPLERCRWAKCFIYRTIFFMVLILYKLPLFSCKAHNIMSL